MVLSLGINLDKIEKIAGGCLQGIVHSYHIDPNEFVACLIVLKEGETLGYNDLSKFISDVAGVLGVSTDKVVISLERGQLAIGFPLWESKS